MDPDRVDGGCHGRDVADGQDPDVVDAARTQGRDGATSRGAETDDDSVELAAIASRDAAQGQCVEHRGVAGQLVVLVERSEEHTYELQTRMSISYYVFHLEKNT